MTSRRDPPTISILDRLERGHVPEPARPRHFAVHCATCGKATSEGKPYCIDHVEQMPYVQHLLAQIAAGALAEDEAEQTQKRPRRRLAESCILALREIADAGEISTADLAARLDRTLNCVYPVVGLLEQNGFIVCSACPGHAKRKIWRTTERGIERLGQENAT